MFLLPTFIIYVGGGEANYCYISFIQKTILPLPYVYVYKKTFYKEKSEFFVYLVRIKLLAMILFSIHVQ